MEDDYEKSKGDVSADADGVSVMWKYDDSICSEI
jgi:hypothetical protein